MQTLGIDVSRDTFRDSFDVAVLRFLIQVLSPDDARQSIMNVGRAINAGGAIYIIGRILDDSRLSPLSAVALNIFYLNAFAGGPAYIESEYRDWLAAAGFDDIRRVVQLDASIMSARKRA